MKKILLVDDEQDILDLLSYNLEKEGYEVFTALNGEQGIEVAKAQLPDLILLDVTMPKKDGVETCSELRSLPEFKDTIIAFLTAREEDYSQLAGFSAGADDYIGKPIKPKVLMARIKALFRRNTPLTSSEEITEAGSIKIDHNKMLVIKDGEPLQLPKMEFNLICLLISNPGKVFSREEIYKELWGENVFVGDRTLDVHVRKLREKLGDNYIKTLKGVGYSFNDE